MTGDEKELVVGWSSLLTQLHPCRGVKAGSKSDRHSLREGESMVLISWMDYEVVDELTWTAERVQVESGVVLQFRGCHKESFTRAVFRCLRR